MSCEYRPEAAREVADATNGDRLPTASPDDPPPLAFDRAGAVASECVATTDWAELRPRVDNEVGCTNRVMSSLWSVLSRAITRVMSRSVRAPTSVNVRAISTAVLARAGDRVVNGPVTTTPVASPWSGMTRLPGWTTRARCSLAKSSAATTFQPARSISATRTRPVKSAATRPSRDVRRLSPSPGVTRRDSPPTPVAALVRASGVCRRPASPVFTPSLGGITSLRGGRGWPGPGG